LFCIISPGRAQECATVNRCTGVIARAGGSDLRLLVNQGHIPTLLFGPCDVKVAPMPDENVSVDELILAVRVNVLAALR
jgi:acetylornithine deacetylase/succinyl-diaminopimelate desuccinylase-like protein